MSDLSKYWPIKESLVVVPALQFIWFIYTLQRRLVRASLQKEIRQEEVLSCFNFHAVWGSLLSKVFKNITLTSRFNKLTPDEFLLANLKEL